MREGMEGSRLKRGFTLIELIIAVALLAVAGAAVVRLFVHAHVNNRMAYDIDRAVFYGSAWVERIKSSPEDWTAGDPSAIYQAVCRSDTYSYVIYYDDGWNPIPYGESRADEAEYAMHIDLYGVDESPGLWAIELRTFKIDPYPLQSGPYEEIYSIMAMVNETGEVMAQ